jgi:hypothetical protein
MPLEKLLLALGKIDFLNIFQKLSIASKGYQWGELVDSATTTIIGNDMRRGCPGVIIVV